MTIDARSASEMDRREFVKSLGAATAVFASAFPSRSNFNKPSNVILMICDDLGSADLGCYGSKLPTPNLDRLATEGTQMMRCNTAHPICSAARAALLTGRYAPRSNTRSVYFPQDEDGMNLDETTLANLFHDKGYRTQAIGKWHLGHESQYLPTSRGFDHYYGVPWSVDMHPLPLMVDEQIVEPNTDRLTLTPRYTTEAIKFLEQPSDDPFFLYLAYSYPHNPAASSKTFQGRSGFAEYGDAVEEIDWSVGEIMKTLERIGQVDNTIVIFTGDHGPWFQGSPGELRGRKGSSFEGGSRIPMLMRWPGHIPAGQKVDGWMMNMDVLPTLGKWCGLEKPRLPIDGVDVSDLIMGRRAGVDRKPIIYFSISATGYNYVPQCIRSGNWKMRIAQYTREIYVLQNMGPTYMLPRPELYRLDLDPTESYDIATYHREKLEALHSHLDPMMTTFPERVQKSYAELRHKVGARNTPPASAPFIPKADQ